MALKTYVEAINEALREEMERDESVFLLGEGVQAGVFLRGGLLERFGTERVMDTPLAENAIAGAAIGAAMDGYRPVADFMFADLLWCAGDEILNGVGNHYFIHAGKVNLPMVLFAAMGGYSRLGPTHSQCPEAIIMHTPGLKLAVPSTPADAKGLLKTAIRDNNPVVFFYHKRLLGQQGEVPDEEYTIPFGEADIKREGDDVTVVATSYQAQVALKVAEEMADRVSVEVIDPRTLEPLDIDTIIASVNKTGRAVIVDEDRRRCGVGSEIGMLIMERAFDSLDAPVGRVGAADIPIASGHIEQYILPQPEDIVAAIEAVI